MQIQVTETRHPKYVVGGLGDMLQTLAGAKKHGWVLCITHFKDAENFYREMDVKADIIYFEKITPDLNHQIQTLTAGLAPLERHLHPDFMVPLKQDQFAQQTVEKHKGKKKKVIGIHPVGSKLSNEFWAMHKQPLKIMPLEFVKGLIKRSNLYLLFGTPEELDSYREVLALKNVIPISFKETWQSLAFVDYCDLIIGIDSSIKAMAGCRKIKSIVLVGDYQDQLRDNLFLNPYVMIDLFKVIKFKQLDEGKLQEVLNGGN